MAERKDVASTQGATHSAGPYQVYFAGGLFTQHDLATNVLIKETVWRLSGGRFQPHLPQSKEARDLDRPDIEAFIRNQDLLAVVRCDIILARFDGLELDSGTVIEFAVAKALGKPTVILRSDTRRLSGKALDDPYNLMLKGWSRTLEIHTDSFFSYADFLSRKRQAQSDSNSFQAAMEAELEAVKKSTDEIAVHIIAGLEAVLKLKSPFPPEYQEVVYKASRYSPGSGFDQLLTEDELAIIIQRLRNNGTL
jgi:nucleoside 2-deoxyribosyltransferase